MSLVPQNVKAFACKVQTPFDSIYYSAVSEVIRGRFLQAIQVRACEERSDELRSRFYGTSMCTVDRFVRNVASCQLCLHFSDIINASSLRLALLVAGARDLRER